MIKFRQIFYSTLKKIKLIQTFNFNIQLYPADLLDRAQNASLVVLCEPPLWKCTKVQKIQFNYMSKTREKNRVKGTLRPD
jgi:hypothetical protein